MTKQPFRPPTVSPAHRKLQNDLQFLDAEALKKKHENLYVQFRKTEAPRYKEAAGFHCCYCGDKRDRLDLDHFRPRGEAKFESPDEELLAYYRFLAKGSPDAAKRKKINDSYFKENSNSQNFANLCIDPDNIIPSCPDCNTGGTNLRDAFDTPCRFGKHNRFPVEKEGSDEPLLLRPSDEAVNWKLLLDYFEFIDLADTNKAPLSGLPAWGGAIRATIVVPNFHTAITEKARLQAATIIEVFGLNRKALSEQRFRMRQMFFNILFEAKEIVVTEADADISNFVANNNPLYVLAYSIRSFLCRNPHKLALLDVLREWLGNEIFDTIDIDRFLST